MHIRNLNLVRENPYGSQFIDLCDHRMIAGRAHWRKRLNLLSQLERSIWQHRNRIREALLADFHKPHTETDLTEIYPVLGEIRLAKAQLRNWLRPGRPGKSPAFWGTDATVQRVPKGVCLIITPWNYPVNLPLGQLVSALAAGNTVLLKPSEMAPRTAELISEMIGSLFPKELVCVVNGTLETAKELLKLPFDHIVFTGSNHAGKEVMQAAAGSGASVTLELGGKSPCYIHHDAAPVDAAQKIAAAKFVNAGQSCVAPDYVLVHQDIREAFVGAMQSELSRYHHPQAGAAGYAMAHAINQKHYNRLLGLLGTAPGQQSTFIPPTLLLDPEPSHPAMQHEIFGPLLPIIQVGNESEAIKFIHGIPESLCISVFTRDPKLFRRFGEETTSGTLSRNDCAVHFLNPALPFGGNGFSGSGRLHGHAGFLEFTNERVLFRQRIGFTMAKLLYPPYGKFKRYLIEWVLRYF